MRRKRAPLHDKGGLLNVQRVTNANNVEVLQEKEAMALLNSQVIGSILGTNCWMSKLFQNKVGILETSNPGPD